MRYTQDQLASRVDQLGALRRQISDLEAKAQDLSTVLMKAGGAEGKRFVASIVRMPERVQVIKAHKQLRTYEKK